MQTATPKYSSDDFRYTSGELPRESVTVDTLLDRVRALRPRLLEEQEETERRGTYSPEMRNEFERVGLYAMIQPKRFGGLELSIRDYYRIIIEIARGCPSTAWCYALGTGKSLMLASFYPEDVQAEIHERSGVIHAGYGPSRSGARPVEGGYLIRGTFNYCSGIPYANHMLGTAPVNGGDADERVSTFAVGKVPDLIEFVLPREQFSVLEDWGDGRTLGMNGSGSFSVQVDEAFVPAGHTMPDPGKWRDGLRDPETGTVGYRLHGNPMYMGYLEYFLTGEISCVMVGAARALLDELEVLMRTRVGVAGLYGNNPHAQGDYGEALKLVDGAEAIMMRGAEMGAEQCETWERTHRLPVPADVWRIANMFQLANQMAWEAGLLGFRQVGTTPLARGQRIQRYFRDLAQERAQATVTGRVFRDAGVKAKLGLGPDGRFPEVDGRKVHGAADG